MPALDYPPHVTLAVYDDIRTEELFKAFDATFADTPRVYCRFERLDYFVTPSAIVLWAAPIISPDLRSIHQRVHALLDPGRCRYNYRPGVWVPHCSLATSVDPSLKEEVQRLVNRPIKPFDVVFDVADCASFMPVEVIHEKELQADA